MAIEVYIPQAVTFCGRPIAEVFAATFYNLESDDPHGALTTHAPVEEGERGPLIVLGARDGGTWRVTLPEVEVYRSTGVGCEFTVFGPAVRERMTDGADARGRAS